MLNFEIEIQIFPAFIAMPPSDQIKNVVIRTTFICLENFDGSRLTSEPARARSLKTNRSTKYCSYSKPK